LELLNQVLIFLSESNSKSYSTKFSQEIIAFTNQKLSPFPERYPPCRFPKLQKLGYRCFLFKKKYVVIYRVEEGSVYIIGVVHSGRHPKVFDELV